jgi:hypothetical protein
MALYFAVSGKRPNFFPHHHSLAFPTGRSKPNKSPHISAFSLRIVLEGLQSLVLDCGGEDVPTIGVPTKSEIRRALAQIHDTIVTSSSLSNSERLETLLRWHTVCLDSCKDSSLLCTSVCSRYRIVQHVCGGTETLKQDVDLVNWVNTDNARKALLHAVAIQEIVEQLPRGRAHVIHIPSSLFAATAVYCVFSLCGLTTVNIPYLVNWQTVLSANYESCAIPGQPDSVSQSETKRHVRREYCGPSGTIGATKNLLYELNSIQKAVSLSMLTMGNCF